MELKLNFVRSRDKGTSNDRNISWEFFDNPRKVAAIIKINRKFYLYVVQFLNLYDLVVKQMKIYSPITPIKQLNC